MKVFFVFFLVLVFGVVSSHGRTHEYNAPTPFKTSTTIDYDEFFLVQQWPQSYCSDRSKRRYCRRYIPSYFTVHGLWAQWHGDAANCEGGKPFNTSCQLNPKTESNLKTYWPNLNGKDQEFWRRELFNWPLKLNPDTDLEANLKEYWPNLNRNGDDCWFWRHEYKTHASCISLFQNDKEKYFSSTLNLAKKYNVTTMLLNEDIKPGRKCYGILEIKNAILKAFNFKPSLECNYAKDGTTVTTVQLFQIFLCFDKNFKPKDCGKIDIECPENHQISFPSPKSKALASLCRSSQVLENGP